MSITIPTQPLISKQTAYSLDIRAATSRFKSGSPQWVELAQVLDRIQDSNNRLEKALRNATDNTFDEIIVRSGGVLIGWIGSRPPYAGAWFKQLYVGADGPDTAPFFADVDGNVIIGKNGSLALQDGGGNEVGWLGVQADAPKNITNATNTNPIVVTVNAHGYEDGDTVFITLVGGNTAANGYRIVQNGTPNTFEITDLDGVNVAGSGAYTSGGTATRYFGGGRFQTIAVGDSFTDYKIRAYADGQLKIRDALITLTDATNNGYIELNPSTGPTALFRNTLTGIQTEIKNGFITVSNYITPGETSVLSYTTFTLYNAANLPSVFMQSVFGAGVLSVHDASGSGTIGLNGQTGQISGSIVDASNEYRVGGVPGIDNSVTVPTGLSVSTASAVTSVDFSGGGSTTSDSFVQSITYTDVTLTHSKGILTAAV